MCVFKSFLTLSVEFPSFEAQTVNAAFLIFLCWDCYLRKVIYYTKLFTFFLKAMQYIT